MQNDHRQALRMPALFDVNPVPVADVQQALIEGFDLRIKICACALLTCGPIHDSTIYPKHPPPPLAAAPDHVEHTMQPTLNTVDPAEIAKFQAMAAEWWDPNGKFRPLHMLNPCRLDYITRQIAAEFGRDLTGPAPFKGLRLLDIGCGGGLLSEPMARLGATVVGADAAERNIPVAQVHAAEQGLTIDYRHTTAEALAYAGEAFDVVLNMEVVEHVADPQGFITTCHDLLKPGGLMICSTLNRNPKSFAMAIVGAEWVMRWLPKGTHDWAKFITPDELYGMIRSAGLTPVDRKGFVFNPVSWSWSLSDRDLSVNYVTASTRT
jgi:2-polyprenyl-6-hydroxyphenyl methylase/3-demethylubiquinone-9 3-methyltransferase